MSNKEQIYVVGGFSYFSVDQFHYQGPLTDCQASHLAFKD